MAVFSTIQKSQLEGAKRLDAEYYQPEYLENSGRLQRIGFYALQELSKISITKGETPLWRGNDYLTSGVPFLRSENLVSIGLDTSRLVFISEDVDTRMRRSRIYPNDILVAIVGATIGQFGLVTDEYPQYNSNQAIAIVRPHDEQHSAYLAIILESEFCRLQIERLKGGGARDNLDLHEVRIIKIPKPTEKVLSLCLASVSEIKRLKKESEFLYSKAESLLLEELGLRDFKADEDLHSIVNFSDIKSANRMDAEYFQPKYEKLIAQLKKNNSQLLGDLVTMKKGVEPGSEAYAEEGKLFIRVSSISKFGLTDKDQKYISDALYGELKDNYVPKVGEILLTKDASPGVACVLRGKTEGVVSGGVMRLKVKEKIDTEYLALCINSLVGQLQVERDAGGSIIAHWKPEQIKQVQIPVLPEKTQQKIAELVRESHEARTKAKQLLEEAKHKVEELIESNAK